MHECSRDTSLIMHVRTSIQIQNIPRKFINKAHVVNLSQGHKGKVYETHSLCSAFCNKGCFFVRLLLVLRGHSVVSSPPQRPMTSDFEGFLSQILSITFLTILILEKEPVFPFFNVVCQTRELLVPFL